ncbi:hypothetical protein STCU_01797 [Strigomonas culicis]|uniref:EF-hand domain-containing protein n=1 Tax=Strigomonas culicis TaxID=28005 RepID=S9UZL1_9TRYP|nr:hypothetical protein STCU_02746 [Strigomonas culicis]EPY34174.1 hypothetical protein STCU_01797 [Strigomonas culicis]|eukprot:EPY32691.1 hypothetical protein STCU_02746 [Strigomonas culicis]
MFRRQSHIVRSLFNGGLSNAVRFNASAVGLTGAAGAPRASTQLTQEELQKVAQLMENDPRVLMEVVSNLDPECRRRLIVAGGAMEWFGKETAAREVANADVDNDHEISPKDFNHWFHSAMKRKQEERKKKGVEPSAAETLVKEERTIDPTKSIPVSVLCLIGLEAGLPFVGFGFLDNATMLLAGDFIDGTLGFYLNCSVLASAAMGNVCSGLLGMQVHGLIDKAVQKLNFDTPVLTDEQMKDRRVFFAGHMGGTFGIMIGLILGMCPLLFIDNDANEKTDYAMFQKWDKNNSGFIESPEIEKVLEELGLTDTSAKAEKLMKKYGTGGRVTFEDFCEFKDDLREGKPIFE